MKCGYCNGTGEHVDGHPEDRVKCLDCNGMGELCDACGEAVDEHGQSVCEFCLDDGGDL